jgi:hypothetical protein
MSMSVSGVSPVRGAGGFDPSKMASTIASRMMSELDTNNDGSLDKAEFVAGLKSKGVSAEDAGKQFDAIDTAKSGKIGKSEIEAALKAGKVGPPRGAPPPGGPGGPGGPGRAGGAPASSAKATDPADTNQDGKVSAQEALLYSIAQEAKANAIKPAASSTATFEKMA